MPDIRQQVFIKAPALIVFDALTTQQGLAAWWTPYAEAGPVLNSIARFPFSSGYVKEMKIMQLKEPFRVEWRCIAGADEWIGTDISFTLHNGTAENLLESNPEIQDQVQQQSPFEHGTIVHLQHNNWANYTLMFAECSYTWAQFLRSLKLYCQTGTGTPWPNQHKS